jgi:hypothetical protein
LAYKNSNKSVERRRPSELRSFNADVEGMGMSMSEEGFTHSEENDFISALPNVIHAGFRVGFDSILHRRQQ